MSRELAWSRRPRWRRLRWLPVAPAIVLAAIASAAIGAAQTLDVERPQTLVVGTPGGARTDRIDAARSGRVAAALPAGAGLRTEWKTSLGTPLDGAPVVDGHGTAYVVSGRGEVVAVARDGTESWRVSTNAIQPGPPALLSDDTVVFADAAGEAFAVRDGALRWRVRFGRVDPTRATPSAPLPLDDGGVVVATTRDLAAFDPAGRERARTTLPEPSAASLVAALGKVVAVTTSGAVWSWTPGAPEPTRIASFGGPIEDGAALADDHTLLAITADRLHLESLDLVRGSTTMLASSGSGLFLGPLAVRGRSAFLGLQAASGDLAVAFDASGGETLRALLATRPPAVAGDGGPATLVAAPHTGVLVDGAGALAFATAEGSVGVLAGGVVDLVGAVCSPVRVAAGGSSPVAPVVGMAPLGPGAFVAACRAGSIVAIAGSRSGEPAPSHL